MPRRETISIAEYHELQKQKSKYRNRKVQIDGHTFDSQAEAQRYEQLRLMEKAGAISDLRLHPKYELQHAFTDSSGVKQRAITYVADFEYVENGQRITEDTKGAITKEYAIKKKLFLYKYFDRIFREIKV